TTCKGRLGFGQSIRGQRSAILADNNNVRPVPAKFSAKFRLHIGVQIEHGSSYGGGHNHSHQRGCGTSAPKYRCSHEHAQEHGCMRPVSAASDDLGTLWDGAHASPRSANTGSNNTALRIAAALPAKVTTMAITRMMGKRTG